MIGVVASEREAEEAYKRLLISLRQSRDILAADHDARSFENSAIEGEVLPRLDEPGAEIVYHSSPFAKRSERIALPAGATLRDAVGLTGLSPRLWGHLGVYVDDLPIPRERWAVSVPEHGETVFIRVELQGGGNGEQKHPLRALLTLALVVVTAAWGGPFAGATGFWARAANYAAQAFVLTAGQFLINALVPPPKIENKHEFDQQPGNPYAALAGLRNRAAPFEPIPRIIGKRRVYPLIAARPYSEMQGGAQYLRMLFLVGYGPLRISDIRLGQTPISAFAGAEVEIREGWDADAAITLYTKEIKEEDFWVLLEGGTVSNIGGNIVTTHGPAQVRYTDPDTTEVSVDVTFPNGLCVFDHEGNKRKANVQFRVEWSPDDVNWYDANWIDPKSEHGTKFEGYLQASEAIGGEPVVRSGRFPVSGNANGRYAIGIRRETAKGVTLTPAEAQAQGRKASTTIDEARWSVLRSIKQGAPTNMDGLTLIAVRLKATAQLNGVPDTINCIAESYLPVWNGSAWSYEITRNVAWSYADMLRRRGLKTMLADARVDAAGLLEWAGDNWNCDLQLDGGSVYTALETIAAHGRAQPALVDGKYGVVRDVEKTVPVQHISPRNSRDYRGSKVFVDIPHAFRVRFTNSDKDYALDEVIVYRDGYNANGTDGNQAATKFDTLDYPGSDATGAAKHGRYQFAVLQLRPEEHSVTMDVEAIRCTKGDLVRFSHDVVSIGLGHGRISGRTIDGSNITHLDLDAPVDMETGTTYAARVRHSDLTSSVHTLVTVNGSGQSTVELASPVAASTGPQVGDLVQFGIVDLETAPMIVKRIDPGPDLSARLTLVDAQPGVWTADQGAIPAFSTYITHGAPVGQTKPERPSISVSSDAAAVVRQPDGTLIDRIVVTLAPPKAGAVPLGAWEVEWRVTPDDGDGDWRALPQAPIDQTSQAIERVRWGESYDIRARTIAVGAQPSDWVYVDAHLVTDKRAAAAAGDRNANWLAPFVVLPPPSFDVYADGDDIVAVWTRAEPASYPLEYEVRYGGATWDASVALPKTSALTLRFKLPPSESQTSIFWIKSFAFGGVYSNEARAASVKRVPTTSANVVYDRDFKDESWPGVHLELTEAGFGGRLGLATTNSTVRSLYGDYYAPIDLGDGALTARTTIETAHNRTADADITLQELDFTWAEMGDRKWGELYKDNADDVILATYFSVDSEPPADLVEGFPLVTDADGVNGTLPIDEIATFGAYLSESMEVWIDKGVKLAIDGSDGYITWAVTTPEEFTFVIDLIPDSAAYDEFSYVVARLFNTAGGWLELRYDHASDQYVLTDHLAQTIEIAAPDFLAPIGASFTPARIAISQSDTMRRLYHATHKDQTPQSVSAEFAPVGVFNRLRVGAGAITWEDQYDATWADLGEQTWLDLREGVPEGISGPTYPPLKASNVEVRSTPVGDGGFLDLLKRGMAGSSPFRPLVAADYTFEKAYVWQHLEAPLGARGEVSIAESYLFADVPDIRDSGAGASIGTSSTLVSFNRDFYASPQVFVQWRTGATAAAPRVDSVTDEGFHVSLISLVDGTTLVAGTIDWAAFGYGR